MELWARSFIRVCPVLYQTPGRCASRARDRVGRILGLDGPGGSGKTSRRRALDGWGGTFSRSDRCIGATCPAPASPWEFVPIRRPDEPSPGRSRRLGGRRAADGATAQRMSSPRAATNRSFSRSVPTVTRSALSRPSEAPGPDQHATVAQSGEDVGLRDLLGEPQPDEVRVGLGDPQPERGGRRRRANRGRRSSAPHDARPRPASAAPRPRRPGRRRSGRTAGGPGRRRPGSPRRRTARSRRAARQGRRPWRTSAAARGSDSGAAARPTRTCRRATARTRSTPRRGSRTRAAGSGRGTR